MFRRSLRLPDPSGETFFLWGARQTGKTTLLRESYPNAVWVDLLKSDEFRRFLQNPERLREELSTAAPGTRVVIDEVQKVPALLDEVHWLIENRALAFALSGSSARKVRQGQANLLGGRAIRYELFGLTLQETGSPHLIRLLNHGYLPRMYEAERPRRLLNAYVADYLKEEIAAEGLVRQLPAFSSFLDIAALSDGEIVNFSTIARDCGVSSPTIKSYFGILEDTLIASWLSAYTKRAKRRVIAAPKLYFKDVGVVNHLTRRGELAPGTELFGKAFENWVHHELAAFNSYAERFARLSYWRLAGGTEVDFIVDDMRVAIEAKATKNVTIDHLRGLRQLAKDHPKVGKRIVVSLEPRPRQTSDGITILPASTFATQLQAGTLM